jgi:ketosteroid isomerase-like protein
MGCADSILVSCVIFGESELTLEISRRRALSALAAVVVGIGAAALIALTVLHPHVDAGTDHLANLFHGDVLRQRSAAPPDVQAGVRAALSDFEDGYVRRDPKALDAFMSRLFENNDDVLMLGTGPSEWSRGFPAAKEFVRRDWALWGDFRFAADDAIVSSSGDVAWIATIGTVHYKKYDRPVRLSAVLTRHGDRWLFRQMQFQYEDSGATAAGLLLLHR